MKTLTFTMVVILYVIFFSCDASDDVNPFATNTKTPVFFLLFEVNGNHKVDVEFSTNSMSVIPTVTVNEDTLNTSIDFHDGIIRGELHNLQFSKTYKYSVAINNKKTSGEMTMPTCPIKLRCNDTLLVQTQLNFLSKADSLKISWSCESFDHFFFNWTGNCSVAATIMDTTVTFVYDGGYHCKLNLVSAKGPCLNPGTPPNVTGDCGDGFVLGLSEELEYSIWFNGAILTKVRDRNKFQIKDKIKSKSLEYLRLAKYSL